jgi:glyoxylase-like metal-dependent hydrolase (beta-lactamase superfamily II)
MGNYICETCGVQYGLSVDVPERCVICAEERQYINPKGQSWTTLEEMIREARFENTFNNDERGIYNIHTTPDFAIGQTAYLVQGPGFNVLWDCISLIDSATIDKIKSLGGIQAIALSHPHYYSTQVEWAETFDAPIYIHEDDRQWVTRQSGKIVFWSGQTRKIHDGFVLHRLGGHFKGAAILERQGGQEQKGVLFTGDIVRVVADPRWATFMYSYPNFIPLPPNIVQRMADQLKSVEFDRLYDAFHRSMKEDAYARVQRSAKRYVDAVNGQLFQT